MNDYESKKPENIADQGSRILADGTHDVFDLCQKIKFVSAELHHYFAELFKDDRSSLLFWKRTAMEEENNAKEFALIAKLRRQNIVHSLRIDPVEAEVIYIFLQTLIERMKEQPPNPEEALRTAVKVEEKITPFHLNNMVQFSDNSFRKLFSAAILADQERVETFRRAIDRLSDVGQPS